MTQPSLFDALPVTASVFEYALALTRWCELGTGAKARRARDYADEIARAIAAEAFAKPLPEPKSDLCINEASYYTFDSEYDDETQARELYREARAEQAHRWFAIQLMEAALAVRTLPEQMRQELTDDRDDERGAYESCFIELEMAFNTRVAKRMRKEIETAIHL